MAVTYLWARTVLTPSSSSLNLIDLVIISEAYTQSQADRFYSDIIRLVNETFVREGAAFDSLCPLLRIHAVFVPSKSDVIPTVFFETSKHRFRAHAHGELTAFGLRREDGPLRTIAPRTNQAYSRARSIARIAVPSVDHVILLVQDEWYGGLGDEVAIITSSHTSGALALRHELGHILGDIGEEYDGGADYSGPNFAKTNRVCGPSESFQVVSLGGVKREVWPCIPWKNWLDPSVITDSLVSSPSVSMPLAAWPFIEFTSLNQSVDFRFSVDGGGLPHSTLSLSTAGVAPPGEFSLSLDGVPLGTVHPKVQTLDRQFHAMLLPKALSSGPHTLSVQLHTTSLDHTPSSPPPMICHIQLHLSSLPMLSSPADKVGAFPVLSRRGQTLGYRPTMNGCLMRDMRVQRFCPVCMERLWVRSVQTVGLLANGEDGVIQARHTQTRSGIELVVHPISLGSFMSSIEFQERRIDSHQDLDSSHTLSIHWFIFNPSSRTTLEALSSSTSTSRLQLRSLPVDTACIVVEASLSTPLVRSQTPIFHQTAAARLSIDSETSQPMLLPCEEFQTTRGWIPAEEVLLLEHEFGSLSFEGTRLPVPLFRILLISILGLILIFLARRAWHFAKRTTLYARNQFFRAMGVHVDHPKS